MKFKILVCVFSLVSALFVGCDALGSQPDSCIEQLSGKIYVYTDPQTGLQYLVYTVNGGICPRYGADGKQLSGVINYD